MKNKIAISVVLLLMSASIVYTTVYRLHRIARMDEFIRVTATNIILNTRYRYSNLENRAILTQRLRLSPFNSNILGVFDRKGAPIGYARMGNILTVVLGEPVPAGKIVEYTVESRLDPNRPYFNIVNHNNNNFTLHYVSMDPTPAMKTKQFILPENAQIIKVSSSRQGVETADNAVRVRETLNDNGHYDISIEFALYDNSTVSHVKATPPEVENGSNIIIRASKELYDEPPTIRGDFTGWSEVKMRDGGDCYIFVTNIQRGRYYYQIRYCAEHTADDSVPERQIIIGEESASVMTVGF